MQNPKSKIKEYYDSNPLREWARLDKYGIEFQVTFKHLGERLRPNSKILDVGGGPGRYAFALTREGHKVHLADLSPGHIELAHKKEGELGIKLASASVIDAEDLSHYDSDSFDAVLNLGPLYHIQSREQRLKTISESLRVVKKGGLCAFGFLSIYAPVFDVVKKDPNVIAEKFDDLVNIIHSGIHVESKEKPGFTDIFLIDPMKIEKEFESFAVKEVSLFGSEGLTAQSETKLNRLGDDILSKWADLAYMTSTSLAGINCSEHIVYIVEKVK